MGNCLEAPEPKAKRHHYRHKRQRMSAAEPVMMFAPPGALPPVGPEDYYAYQPHPHLYQYNPGVPAGYMLPGLPGGHALMVDPATGQEFLVPMADQPYQDPQYVYYTDYPDAHGYYEEWPNGVHQPRVSRRHRRKEDPEKDEVDKGEARALRRRSREERKTSQGHDTDKMDIRDAASFQTTAIVTATTPTKATEKTTSALLTSSTTTAAAAAAAGVAAATLTTTSNHTEHVISADPPTPVETSRFESYVPTPPPTPPLPSPPPSSGLSMSQMDANKDNNQNVNDTLNVDETDHSMARRLSVSFDQQPALIIPQNQFDTAEDNNDDEEEEESPGVVTSQGVVPQILFSKPARSFDVVITYSILARLESDIVRRLSSLLESSGLTVWAERLGDSSRARKSDATAKAILRSKVVVVILSEGSCHQRFIRDHVALATVINAPIYPVTTQPPRDVMEALPLELKLQLPNDSEEWTEIGDNNEYSFLFNLRSLARSVQEDAEYFRDQQQRNDQLEPPMAKRVQRRRSSTYNLKAANFWDVHFGHRHSVKWERMQRTIQDEFYEQLKSLVDSHSQPSLLEGLKKKICDDQDPDTVTKARFSALCSLEDVDIDVWEAILKIARTEQAVRDIFDTESTVRHLVLEQEESLGGHSVIEILCDLLSDTDANMRAVSVVSLSKCMRPDDTKALHLVMATLRDEDRLVREAGCLALGNLKLHSAVSKLIHLWRNDVISHVREAAFLALGQMDSEEVEEAIRMTAVLSDEIRLLTADNFD